MSTLWSFSWSVDWVLFWIKPDPFSFYFCPKVAMLSPRVVNFLFGLTAAELSCAEPSTSPFRFSFLFLIYYPLVERFVLSCVLSFTHVSLLNSKLWSASCLLLVQLKSFLNRSDPSKLHFSPPEISVLFDLFIDFFRLLQECLKKCLYIELNDHTRPLYVLMCVRIGCFNNTLWCCVYSIQVVALFVCSSIACCRGREELKKTKRKRMYQDCFTIRIPKSISYVHKTHHHKLHFSSEHVFSLLNKITECIKKMCTCVSSWWVPGLTEQLRISVMASAATFFIFAFVCCKCCRFHLHTYT